MTRRQGEEKCLHRSTWPPATANNKPRNYCTYLHRSLLKTSTDPIPHVRRYPRRGERPPLLSSFQRISLYILCTSTAANAVGSEACLQFVPTRKEACVEMATAFLCAHIHPSNLAPRVGDIYVPSFECWDVAVSAPLASPRAHAVHRQWQRQAAGGSRFDHHQTAEGKKKKKSIDRALYICACVFSIAICKQGVAIKKCTLPRESSQAAGGYVRCLCVQVPKCRSRAWRVRNCGPSRSLDGMNYTEYS